ncbi:MAG: right-handed parallel beta-helix repeat-containing protein, partial [Maritimibacter sp.]
ARYWETISITDSAIHGDATEARVTADSYVAEDFGSVRDSSGFVFENNTVSNYNFGLRVMETTDVTIGNNDFNSLQGDPIQLGGVQGVDIMGNHIHDLLGSDHSLNHMDMIQLWSANTTLVSKDIHIADNIFDSGDGAATQSIWMRNERVDQSGGSDPDLYYSNIVIENNVIYNGHVHGIAVGETDGLVISNNTLITNTQSSFIAGNGTENTTTDPGIFVASSSTGVVITDNITSAEPTAPEGSTVSGNYIIDYINESAENYVGSVFMNAEDGGGLSLNDLLLNPDGPLGDAHIGAGASQFDPTPDTLTPIAVVDKVDGQESVLRFSAKFTADADGLVGATDALYTWTFEDGRVFHGQTVDVAFDETGPKDYVLTVKTADESASVDKVALVEDPMLFSLNAQAGIVTDTSVNKVSFMAEDVSDAINITEGKTFEVTRDNAGLFSRDQFTLKFDLKSAHPLVSVGTIAFIHQSWKLAMNANGDLAFSMETVQGKHYQLITSGAGLNDSKWHNVAVSFDGIAGNLAIFVDDEKISETEAFGTTKGKEYWGLVFGDPWSDEVFTGQINNIEMTADPYSPELSSDSGAIGGLDPNTTTLDGSLDPVLAGEFSGIPGVIEGTLKGDKLHGSENADTIYGNGGRDWIYGNGGDDLIYLGDEDWGSAFGGQGDDTIYGASANDKLFGEDGNDSLFGGDGNDLLSGGAGNDFLSGGAGRDVLLGEAGDDFLIAGGSDDFGKLDGGAGNDILLGGDGRDFLLGGDGNDILNGAKGNDDLTGGSGKDQFVFEEGSDYDRILDFDAAEDTIVLKGLGFSTLEELFSKMFDNHGNLIINLDGSEGEFSWTDSDYVQLMGINLDDLDHSNFLLVA